MKSYLILVFLLINLGVKSQNEALYFSKYAINLNDLTSDDLIIRNDIKSYAAFFIGEEHELEGLARNEILLSNYILQNKKIEYMFFETPYAFYKEYNNFNHIDISADSSKIDFNYLSVYDKVDAEIFQYIYHHNSQIDSSKITVIPIDETQIEEMDDDFILNKFYLYNEQLPVEIKRDLVAFKKLIRLFEKKSKREIRYLNFIKSFNVHDKLYKGYLKSDYSVLKNTLDGVAISIKDRKQLGDYYYISEDRENYMLNNIAHYVDSTKSFISFNGQFHIPLETQKEFYGIENWQSLASKYNIYSKKKSCSIYLLNLEKDSSFGKYYSEEKRIISENIKGSGSYLIKLDGKDSPFNSFADKFQYILVW